MSLDLGDRIKNRARELGFDLVGITGAEPSVFAAEYRAWLERGFSGEMGYLERSVERRLDPRELLPDARSIIVVGMNYYTEDGSPDSSPRKTRKDTKAEGEIGSRQAEIGMRGGLYPQISQITQIGNTVESFASPVETAYKEGSAGVGGQIQNPKSKIQNEAAVFARYARGDDYHDVMTPRLRELLAFLKAEAGGDADGRVYVDTGPILEREVARRAGLGWFGKNTMLINTRRGSYFLLGEIVTNVELPPDAPAVGGCGTCTRCIDACPTGAIVAPFELDARRCISYLTIELKGPIPEEFHPAIAETGRIFGCDICQECCPFNRPLVSSANPTLTPTAEPAFQPRDITVNSTLADLSSLSEEEFRRLFKSSPVKRAKWRGLMRNVAVGLAQPAESTTLQRSELPEGLAE